MRYTNHNLKGASATLVDILVSTSMTGWVINLFLEMKSAVAQGLLTVDDQFDYFRDSIIEGNILKNFGIKEDAVDWVALFEFCDSFFSVKPEEIEAEIQRGEFSYKQMLQGYLPKPLNEVISKEEFEQSLNQLRNYEFGKSFRSYKIDRILALIDWLDRNRGPLPAESLELSASIKSVTLVKSGEYLANLWTTTLPLRYPSGIAWRPKA